MAHLNISVCPYVPSSCFNVISASSTDSLQEFFHDRVACLFPRLSFQAGLQAKMSLRSELLEVHYIYYIYIYIYNFIYVCVYVAFLSWDSQQCFPQLTFPCYAFNRQTWQSLLRDKAESRDRWPFSIPPLCLLLLLLLASSCYSQELVCPKRTFTLSCKGKKASGERKKNKVEAADSGVTGCPSTKRARTYGHQGEAGRRGERWREGIHWMEQGEGVDV